MFPSRVHFLRDELLRELVVTQSVDHGQRVRIRWVREPSMDERDPQQVEDGRLGGELEARDALREVHVHVEALRRAWVVSNQRMMARLRCVGMCAL